MDKIIIWKLKKYLLYVSILLGIITSGHLIYIYLYTDSNDIAIHWTVSEGIIWELPNFNPLISNSDHNRYINYILYRSILKYDTEKKDIVSDLMTCNIDSLSYIECLMEDNMKWSNGEEITVDDVYTTLNLLKETEINLVMNSYLKTIDIEKKEWSIIFKNSKENVNFLNIFFQPIMPEKIINSLSQSEIKWKIPYINGIYSWKYKVSSISQDATVWITKIVFDKNEYYNDDDNYIDQIVLKLFEDTPHLLKNKSSINIFNDKNNIIWNSITRLESIDYTLPQFVGIFLNKSKMDSLDLRKFILENIDRNTIIQGLWEENVKEIKNPFLTNEDIPLNRNQNFNLTTFLSKKWYYSKDYLMGKVLKVEQIKNAERFATELESEVEKPEKPKIKQEDLKIIISPKAAKKYNFITEDNIRLQWKVEDKDVEAIYINDYKLKLFKKWDDFFYYRLSEASGFDSIKQWKNVYKIYSEKAWEKTLLEEVVYFFYKDANELKKAEEDLFGTNETEESVEKSEEKPEQEDLSDFENIDKIILDKLDPNFFYDKNLKPYSKKIYYTDSEKNIETTANKVKEMIEKQWIKVDLQSISMSTLTDSLIIENFDYDMVIIWLNLWYFEFNLFPYFHSSQLKSWYNFSNINDAVLDVILAELKAKKWNKTEIMDMEKEVIKILSDEQIVKTFYTPKLKILIDKNIKKYNVEDSIPENIYRYDFLLDSHLSKKEISFEWKGVSDFFSFMFKSLFGKKDDEKKLEIQK